MSLWQTIKSALKFNPDSSAIVKLEEVEQIIGYAFRDRDLLRLSLTHRSFSGSGNSDCDCNERLEFLGDSVLGLVIAARLYEDNPDDREGDLTKVKAMMVNEITLSNIGQETKLNRHILMSPEEEKSGGRRRSSIVSDALESVIGAVYLDGGFEAARDVVLRIIYSRRDKITSDATQRNYKGDLLELIQARGKGMPRYEVVSEQGPDHRKIFDVIVEVSGVVVGEGRGTSKKEAEQKAASMALEYFESQNDSDDHQDD